MCGGCVAGRVVGCGGLPTPGHGCGALAGQPEHIAAGWPCLLHQRNQRIS